MYDRDGNWFADESMYTASSFKGTKLFSYRQGTGTNDVELGFPISYRAIENVGDIEFDFNLTSDTFTYQVLTEVNNVETRTGFLRKYKTRTDFDYKNGWQKADTLTTQKVVRQYDVDTLTTSLLMYTTKAEI